MIRGRGTECTGEARPTARWQTAAPGKLRSAWPQQCLSAPPARPRQVVLAIEAEADPSLNAAPVLAKGSSTAAAIKRRLSTAPRADGESLGDLLKSEGEV